MNQGRIVVWGAGSWGTALALHLHALGNDVAMWVYEKPQYEEMAASGENPDFLPGHPLPGSLKLFHDPKEVPEGARLWLSATPAQAVRTLWTDIGSRCSQDTLVVTASKGIERTSLLFMSAVIESFLPPGSRPVTSLSGPSFATGVAGGDPTAFVLASPDADVSLEVQRIFSGRNVRGYASTDRTGVELGGAVKNIIAIACGIASGLGFGHNTVAALITRGLREIVRLGECLGADPLTFAGLSGVGDLVLTCTGGESRNRTVGFRLGRGETLRDILGGMKMVAEGVETTRSVADLSRREGVEMPITLVVERIIFEDLHPRKALEELLSRDLKPESW